MKVSIGGNFSGTGGGVFCNLLMIGLVALSKDGFLLWLETGGMVVEVSEGSFEFAVPAPGVSSVDSNDGMLGRLGGLSEMGDSLGSGLRWTPPAE